MAIIVLDPGHGGADSGAVYNNYFEKDFNLAIARETKNYLSAHYNAETHMTVSSDSTVDLAERVNSANNLGADVFVSIHINAGGGTGFESYIYTSVSSGTESIQQTMHKVLAEFYQALGFPDRGMKRANFFVLRNTIMPAILLENLFIDNPRDLDQLREPGFTSRLGERIGLGVARAMNLPASSAPPAEPEQPPASGVWDPQQEIERLRRDGLVANEYRPTDPVNWGQFATVLNRLRDTRRFLF